MPRSTISIHAVVIETETQQVREERTYSTVHYNKNFFHTIQCTCVQFFTIHPNYFLIVITTLHLHNSITIEGCCWTRHLTYEEPEGVEMRRPGMGVICEVQTIGETMKKTAI